MAKKIKHSMIRSPIGQDKCILQLQVAVKSKLLEAKVDGGGYTVELQEESELLNEPNVKIIAAPPFQDISSALEGANRPPRMLSIDKIQRKRIGKDSSIIQFAKENGGVVLRIQGKKGNLKQLIRATLLKSCRSIIGLYQDMQKSKIFHGTFKVKKDGVLSKCILPLKQANKLSADVHLMQELCNKDELILLPGMVEGIHRDVVKYWLRRYSLFSRFDEGVKLDEEGLFSVTPEEIAKHQASHCGSGTVIDAFTGVGGNAIQFASMNFNVIAIDIDPKKIEYARHNAEVYGVSHKIDFLVGDFLQLAATLKADVVFLSPPWGGPEYIKAEKYNIETMLRPSNGFSLFKLALSIAPSVAFFLPRTVDAHQLAQLSCLSSPALPYEIERNYVNDELKAVTAYYGKIVG